MAEPKIDWKAAREYAQLLAQQGRMVTCDPPLMKELARAGIAMAELIREMAVHLREDLYDVSDDSCELCRDLLARAKEMAHD